MKYLNLGCGGQRDQSQDWTNLDDLFSQLPEDGHEVRQLLSEINYVNYPIGEDGVLHFHDGRFEGILASHFFEHFDCQHGLRIMKECRRILRPNGVLLVSVPNASYFRSVYHKDRNSSWPELYGVVDPANPIPTFFEAALWFDQHKAIMTADSLWCYFTMAGFTKINEGTGCPQNESVISELAKLVNREKFSLIANAVK